MSTCSISSVAVLLTLVPSVQSIECTSGGSRLFFCGDHLNYDIEAVDKLEILDNDVEATVKLFTREYVELLSLYSA